MLCRILVPLDSSRFAKEALPVALHLARRDDAQVDLITVQEPPLPVTRTGTAPVRDPAFAHEVQRQACAYLDEVADRLEADD